MEFPINLFYSKDSRCAEHELSSLIQHEAFLKNISHSSCLVHHLLFRNSRNQLRLLLSCSLLNHFKFMIYKLFLGLPPAFTRPPVRYRMITLFPIECGKFFNVCFARDNFTLIWLLLLSSLAHASQQYQLFKSRITWINASAPMRSMPGGFFFASDQQ